MRSIVKGIVLILIVYVVVCIVTPFSQTLLQRSIRNQITSLSLSLQNDDDIQARYPEGRVFANAIFALATIDAGLGVNTQEQKEYAHIVDDCINRLLSQNAKATFDHTMQPPYGVFYNGWTNFVLTSYASSHLFAHSSIQDSILIASMEINNRLSHALSSKVSLLDTYSGSSWPADNMVTMVGLTDSELQTRWLDHILNLSEHESELIPHTADDMTVIRGSSQALMTYCIQKIANPRSQHYYETYDSLFIDNILGIDLVKEHLDTSNEMDYDTGPILFGYGASATIMNIKTQAAFGKPSAKYTWAMMNLLGIPINLFGCKYYLFKQEPMFDIFMLWASVEFL